MSFSATTPIALAGPTASGKSEIALLLADRLGGEIISVDSMQVYRGLDIGTAKPSLKDRQGIPHHLIDIATLDEPFDAAAFVTHAQKARREIESRGRRPILCGGTGFYFTAWREGLGESPASNPLLRQELELTPIETLLQELEKSDPATYQVIDRQNSRRVIRAVEVIRLTGRPFSAQRAAWGGAVESPEPCLWFGLNRDQADLQDRIARRVDQMFAHGLVAETENLLAAGLESNRTAMQAIGYRQVVEHLRGARSLPETIELVKIRTRQFAKRQKTWLRKFLPLQWIEVAAQEPAGVVAEKIVRQVDR